MKKALLALALTGCGQEPVTIVPIAIGNAEASLDPTVEQFVSGGRTAVGFAQLVAEADRLRPRLDETAADDIERQLVFLSLPVVMANADAPIAAQVDALARTVWPFALQGRFSAKSILSDDRRNLALRPLADESADAYVARVCDTVLALECRRIVPEGRADIVAAIALARLNERARNAAATCLSCNRDASIATGLVAWGELAAKAERRRLQAERSGDPDNWPIAGGGATAWEPVPILTLTHGGDFSANGEPIGSAPGSVSLGQWLARAKRIGVDAPPDLSVGAVSLALGTLGSHGVRLVQVAAREPTPPHQRKGYWVDLTGTAREVPGRAFETLQVWLRAIDGNGRQGSPVRLKAPSK